MPTREQFLNHLWQHIIEVSPDGGWIENSIANCVRFPKAAFAEVGPILKRLLELGATRQELTSLWRCARYEAVFGTLYALDDPGVDGDDFLMLHESLLGADPSGREGKPPQSPKPSGL